jgi:hypothetical protein
MEGSSGGSKAAAYIFGVLLDVVGPFGVAVIAAALLVIVVEFIRSLLGLP